MPPKMLAFVVVAFAAGATLSFIASQRNGVPSSTLYAEEKPSQPPDDLATLRAEIERLKKVVPDQAHGNWPLAQFYFSETRSHLRWVVRIIPVRKDTQGREVFVGEDSGSLREFAHGSA